MKLARKISFVILSTVLLLFGIYFCWMLWKAVPAAYGDNLRVLKGCLVYYVEENKGEFPDSEQELIQKGYLITEDSRTYLQFPDSTSASRLHRCFRFKSFSVNYGLQYDDLVLIDGKLFNGITNKEVNLINGPCSFILPYDTYSIEIYRKMAEMKHNNLLQGK